MICVDPGVGYYARADFHVGKLYGCALVRNDRPLPYSHETFVIESQYIARGSQVRTDDVIALAQAAGRIAALHPEAIWYLPVEWKGSVPKKAHQERILAALSPEEALCLPGKKGALVHVLDAIGLGLFHVGRL